MAAKTTFTSKELDELREALLKEQGELNAQLAELEESTFSTPQSDLSGEVAFDLSRKNKNAAKVGHPSLDRH